MRQFVCLLHLRHHAAYEQLRKVFPLPHPASLSKQVCPRPFCVRGCVCGTTLSLIHI